MAEAAGLRYFVIITWERFDTIIESFATKEEAAKFIAEQLDTDDLDDAQVRIICGRELTTNLSFKKTVTIDADSFDNAVTAI